MSTVSEIEAALPNLSGEERRRLAELLRQQEEGGPVSGSPPETRLSIFEALKASLSLDRASAQKWADAVREGRR